MDATNAYLTELLHRNAALVAREGEIGVTIFATPGSGDGTGPTFGIHLNRLSHAKIDLHRQRGQAIVLTDVRQPPSACWPRSIKSRSRIHYYLADAFAANHRVDSLGVLIDDDGTITETSTSNIAIVRSGQILSPPADRVLAGVTQLMIELLAQDESLPWIKTPISVSQLVDADEVLLMGTDGGIWFANSVSNHAIGGEQPGDVFLTLRTAFDRLVGAVA
jgi:branched-subunit amino acid aminotransferase/4-amino-4-deoxychorismate lyase